MATQQKTRKRTATPRTALEVIEAASTGPDDEKYLTLRKAGTKRPDGKGEWTADNEGRFRSREVPGYLLIKMGAMAAKAQRGFDLADATDTEAQQAGLDQAEMLERLMRRAVHPADFDAFEEYLIESEPPIAMPELARDVIGAIASTAAGDRPTEPSS